MPKPDFAVIIIGAEDDPRHRGITTELDNRTKALGVAGERLDVISHGQVGSIPDEVRAAAVVLCRSGMSEEENDAIAECLKRNIPIFPVVFDLNDFSAIAPKAIAAFNGFELADLAEIGELAGLVLESLGLQRTKRKIFISYAHKDASNVAQQLRDAFTARWYSVFLDSVSIRPGALFQEELLQELADSDVVVLLNSPSIKNRPYVQKEIAFADQAGVGGVQVVWPRVAPMREGAFFMPVVLDDQRAEIEHDRVKILTPSGTKKILRTVADLRTALQQQREDQLVRPVMAYAEAKKWQALSYLGRYIELRGDSNRIRLDVALGVPTSLDLERAFKSAEVSRATGRLVYDPLGITNHQADHLSFLGSRLALQFLDPKTALQWTIIP